MGLNINLGDNSVLWKSPTEYWLESSPAVSDGKVYIGSQDYKLYCLNASTGSKIWDHMAGYWISSSPAVTKDKVYVGSSDGFLYCLNMTTGETIWQYAVIGDPIWTSSPTIANENVYVGALNCKLYCIEDDLCHAIGLPRPSRGRLLVRGWAAGNRFRG
jgi:outer membrane protein assembly factor BamB